MKRVRNGAEFMRTKEFADLFGVAPPTVRHWLREGLPICRRTGKVPVGDGITWVRSNRPSSMRARPEPMVYFVQRPDLAIKVGYTRDLKRRLQELRQERAEGCSLVLLATFRGGSGDEAAIHRRFSADAIGGEWFRPSLGLLAFIQVVKDDGGIERIIPPLHRKFASLSESQRKFLAALLRGHQPDVGHNTADSLVSLGLVFMRRRTPGKLRSCTRDVEYRPRKGVAEAWSSWVATEGEQPIEVWLAAWEAGGDGGTG